MSEGEGGRRKRRKGYNLVPKLYPFWCGDGDGDGEGENERGRRRGEEKEERIQFGPQLVSLLVW